MDILRIQELLFKDAELKRLRSQAIQVVRLHRKFVWLAEHIKGVEYPKDRDGGCLFWRSKYPDGFTQPFDKTTFIPSLESDWETLMACLNQAYEAGYYAIRIVKYERPHNEEPQP